MILGHHTHIIATANVMTWFQEFLKSVLLNPLRTVVAYMHQGNKLDYHVQTN